MKLDDDNISQIASKVSGSGGGTEMGTWFIVMFDEWNPIVLHQVDFHTGMKADLTAGRDEKIDWKFSPKSDTEKYAQLIEEIYINEWTQGKKDKSPKSNIKRENNVYQFKDKKFVRVKHVISNK